jgi:hypothetical protein
MADKEEAKAGAAEAAPGGKADAKGKRKMKMKMKLPNLPPLPINLIVLVAVPFLVFVAIFLYAMGYFPGKPAVFNISVVTPDGKPAEAFAAEGQPAATDSSTVVEGGAQGETDAMAAGAAGSTAGPASSAEADTAYTVERLARELGLGDSLATAPQPPALTEAEKTKKIKQMAKVYEQMPAASVAAIIENLPEDEAVKILAVMTPRSAAKVMGALGAEKAAVMSLMLTGFER